MNGTTPDAPAASALAKTTENQLLKIIKEKNLFHCAVYIVFIPNTEKFRELWGQSRQNPLLLVPSK